MLLHWELPRVWSTSLGFHSSGTAALAVEVHWLPVMLLPPHLPLAFLFAFLQTFMIWPFFLARLAGFVLPWAVRLCVTGVAAAFACIATAGRRLRAAHIRRMPWLSAFLAHRAVVQGRTVCRLVLVAAASAACWAPPDVWLPLVSTPRLSNRPPLPLPSIPIAVTSISICTSLLHRRTHRRRCLLGNLLHTP